MTAKKDDKKTDTGEDVDLEANRQESAKGGEKTAAEVEQERQTVAPDFKPTA